MIATTKFVNHNSHLESIASTQSTAISHRSRLVERTIVTVQPHPSRTSELSQQALFAIEVEQREEYAWEVPSPSCNRLSPHTLSDHASPRPYEFPSSSSSAAVQVRTSKRYGSIHRADPVLRVQSGACLVSIDKHCAAVADNQSFDGLNPPCHSSRGSLHH